MEIILGRQSLMHYFDCDFLTLFAAVPDFRSGMDTSLETGTAALDSSLAMCVYFAHTYGN